MRFQKWISLYKKIDSMCIYFAFLSISFPWILIFSFWEFFSVYCYIKFYYKGQSVIKCYLQNGWTYIIRYIKNKYTLEFLINNQEWNHWESPSGNLSKLKLLEIPQLGQPYFLQWFIHWSGQFKYITLSITWLLQYILWLLKSSDCINSSIVSYKVSQLKWNRLFSGQ